MLIATSKLADRALDWAVGSTVYPEDTQVLEPDAMELLALRPGQITTG